MFEKIYACLLRLYPLRFRKAYTQEALQLIRDRFGDETGVLKRARLCWDLASDLLVSLPREYRHPNRQLEAPPAYADVQGVPSFRTLEEKPPGHGPFVLGAAVSITTILVFTFVLRWSVAYAPSSLAGGPRSSIKTVIERLDDPATADSGIDVTGEAPIPRATAPSSSARGAIAGSTSRADTTAEISSYSYPSMRFVPGRSSAWSGSLIDSLGRPVRAADIHLISKNSEMVARSREDGTFAFARPPPTNCEVLVVVAGREPGRLQSLDLSRGTMPSQLVLRPDGHILMR